MDDFCQQVTVALNDKYFRQPKANNVMWLLGELGVSQPMIAARLGIRQQSVGPWNVGSRSVPPKHREPLLEMLADALAAGWALVRSVERNDSRKPTSPLWNRGPALDLLKHRLELAELVVEDEITPDW